MVNIDEIVITQINNILNDNISIQQKKRCLFELHQTIIGTKKQKICNLIQEVLKAVRIVDSEKYQKIKQEEEQRYQEQLKQEQEMSSFNLFSIGFQKEGFIMEDLTEQMSNLSVDLKKYKVIELRKIAKNNSLKGYYRLKKSSLIELLEGIENLKL